MIYRHDKKHRKETPIQKLIEEKVTNGLGYLKNHTPNNFIEYQVHLAEMSGMTKEIDDFLREQGYRKIIEKDENERCRYIDLYLMKGFDIKQFNAYDENGNKIPGKVIVYGKK